MKRALPRFDRLKIGNVGPGMPTYLLRRALTAKSEQIAAVWPRTSSA
jgi:hypothetical protein